MSASSWVFSLPTSFRCSATTGWPTHRVRFRSRTGTTDDTVVLIRFEELHTVANRLDVKVLVLPDDSMIDHRLQVLTTDTSVRLYPENELEICSTR